MLVPLTEERQHEALKVEDVLRETSVYAFV